MTSFDTDVLVVDDDTTLREFLTFLLTEEGYAVRNAADGRAALTEIMRAAPKLVVSDILMPHVSGVELATILRETGSPVALILMSVGHPDPKLDGVRFLRKPFDVQHFLTTVTANLAPRPVTDHKATS